MVGYEKLLEAASMGVLMIVEGAPTHRAFTNNHWSLYKPSAKAFEAAEKLGLIECTGLYGDSGVYIMTHLGIHFKHYVKSVVEIRENDRKQKVKAYA
jgi:hypothetical protein